MFNVKVGDRVYAVCHRGDGETILNKGEATVVGVYDDGDVRVKFDKDNSRAVLWNSKNDICVLIEVYNSPLYQLIREVENDV